MSTCQNIPEDRKSGSVKERRGQNLGPDWNIIVPVQAVGKIELAVTVVTTFIIAVCAQETRSTPKGQACEFSGSASLSS